MSAWSSGWQGTPPFKVIAEERLDKKGIVYLRWRVPGKWQVESMGEGVRHKDGTVSPRKAKAMERKALAKCEVIRVAVGAVTVEAPLTIRQGLALAIDAKRGLYPKDSAHRREVMRELERAATIWKDRPWNSIKPSDVRALYRTRMEQLTREGHTGHRGTEITVQRVLAVAAWLRSEEAIAPGACVAPLKWKEALAKELDHPTPKRPRHTHDEALAILKVADQIDPRFALLLSLGAELRMGQVVRVKRSDVNREAGTVTVRGQGKKKGGVIVLTAGQRVALERAFTGYLSKIEATGKDYCLFPRLRAGKDTKRMERKVEAGEGKACVLPTTVREWFKAAEKLAKIAHVPGRGPYGIRRVMVDEAKKAGISREGLQAHGGWSTTQVPDMIYADQEQQYAREEAAEIRAKIRGEVPV